MSGSRTKLSAPLPEPTPPGRYLYIGQKRYVTVEHMAEQIARAIEIARKEKESLIGKSHVGRLARPVRMELAE